MSVRALFVVLLTFFLTTRADLAHAGLVINPTFDSSITSDVNSEAIKAGINAAIARAQNAIADNVTINITFQTSNSGLGGSISTVYDVSYSDYRNALVSHQTSGKDAIALASLPMGTTNPVPGNGSSGVYLETALYRALFGGTAPASDGTILLNTSIMNLSRTGPQNSSFYDLQAVAAHEINEILGIGGPGSWLGQTPGDVGVLDLFRYSAAGERSYTTSSSATSYFSIDGGVTNLANFNQVNGADFADWGSGPPRVQNAFGTPGAIIDNGPAELTALDVVGWNLNPVPEPSTFSLVGLGVFSLMVRRIRRRWHGTVTEKIEGISLR